MGWEQAVSVPWDAEDIGTLLAAQTKTYTPTALS